MKKVVYIMNYYDKEIKEIQKLNIEVANRFRGCYWCGEKWKNEADIEIWDGKVVCKDHRKEFEKRHGKGRVKGIND